MQKPHSPLGFVIFKMPITQPSAATILLFSILSVLTACQKPTEKKQSEIQEVPSESVLANSISSNRVKQLETLSGLSESQLIDFDPAEIRQGGESGLSIRSKESYSKPSANITASRKGDFFVGNAFFKQPWVVAPASTDGRDGVGGLFNVAACQSCHIKDGRGHAPINSEDNAISMLIRLSLPATTDEQKKQLANSEMEKIAHPVYGGQLQDRGIPGIPAEAHIDTTWTDVPITFKDGHVVTLRRPTFTLSQVGYGELGDDTMISPRIALPMIGLGLIDHIKADDIMSQADPDDKDKNGISGKYNWVHNSQSGKLDLGRYGWKAGQPTILTQNQAAFNGDMGLTSSLNSDENCTPFQKECLGAPTGADYPVDKEYLKEGETEKLVEVSDDIAKFVEFYARNLAVPHRRNAKEPLVLAGKKRFYEMGCVGCHTPRYQLPTTDDDHLEQHGQIIYPYTDVLLHDMGDDLADRNIAGEIPSKDIQVEFLANSHEWRTQPLWGIGLAQTVDKQAGFLHDGRARSPLEAVLWHGGEAEKAKQKVLELDEQGRKELEAFLNSL